MQSLQTPQLFSFPKPLKLNPATKPSHFQQCRPLLLGYRTLFVNVTVKSYNSDEFPADEEFLKKFAVKDRPTDEEENRINWTVRGWAPWDEVLTPEGQFARTSLDEGEEVPLKNPESVEAFKMLNASYRKKKMKELGLTEDEFYQKQFEIKGEKPPPLETTWTGPMLLRLVPPRDWPPRGWEVDRKELAFIREAHKMQNERVGEEELEGASKEIEAAYLARYKVFLKQYQEWVVANKDRLEKESYKYDQDYYPGRRKRGKDYKEGMYELPFYYPGQICSGEVTMLHLYQGAFVDIGGVYDGWVPIKGNDWFWLRHHIKVGMHVFVEVVAKRDPHRFRFPIELRLIYPNIDHMIFNRFDYPPIFYRVDDTNPDELRRDAGRHPVPRKDPGDKPAEEPLKSEHPYVLKLWQIHNAEQMILDDLETNPDKYEGKKLSELSDGEDFDTENTVEYSKAFYKRNLLPRVILKTSVKELNLEAALDEREFHNKLRKEAEERGVEYKVGKLRRNVEMDEYDFMHWRRSFEEREALIRDIACRKALDLPLEEPGRYVDPSFFGKEDKYDPSNPLYRYDYWGVPKNSEEGRLRRIATEHNKSIVRDGTVMSEMSLEDYIKLEEAKSEQQQKDDQDWTVDDDDDSDRDDELDIAGIFSSLDTDSSDQTLINGVEVYPLTQDDGDGDSEGGDSEEDTLTD